jgi:hypothetical protein
VEVSVTARYDRAMDDAKPRDEKPAPESDAKPEDKPKEIGGRKGPDPTRFGDWEKDGRCVDF